MELAQTLLPLLGVTSYFLCALVVFHVRVWRRGRGADEEVASRAASPLLGRYLRYYMMWMLAPWERAFVRLGISPNALTLASLGAGVCAAIFLSQGRFAAGGWLYLVTGMLDILDGRVARRTHRVTRSGAYFDSVIDRYAELFVFGGLAVYYRSTWVIGVVLVASIGSLMVSYARARGEALGVDVQIGTMQRPERLLYLGGLLAHSPLWEIAWPTRQGLPLYPPAIAALILLGVSANVTAIRRIRHTMRLLDEREAPAAQPVPEQSIEAAPGAVEASVEGSAGQPVRISDGVERLLARPRTVG